MEDLAVRIQKMMNDRQTTLQHFKPEEQAYFVDLTIAKMAQLYGGYHHFWRKEDEKFVFQGWVSGLSCMTPYQIIKIMNYTLEGRHKFSPRPPRTPMEFLDLRRDVNLHNVPSPDATKKMLEGKLQGHTAVSDPADYQCQGRPPEQLERSSNEFCRIRSMLGIKPAKVSDTGKTQGDKDEVSPDRDSRGWQSNA